MNRSLLLIVAFVGLTAGCARPAETGRLARLHIIDRNGLSEIISNKDRLDRYASVDFTRSQPYKQVTRTYTPDAEGRAAGTITSYYSNGQIQQSLDLVDGRAFGWYQEWYPNGQPRVRCRVVGGVANLEPASQASYLFDGVSEAWDEEGHLVASIGYEKGVMQGPCIHYHSNGLISLEGVYHQNRIEGELVTYFDTGAVASRSHYEEGRPHGPAQFFWPDGSVQATEEYVEGLLKEAIYSAPNGKQVAQIKQGDGQRAIFDGNKVIRREAYHHGIQQGLIECFDGRGHLTSTFSTRNGEKHGTEIIYYIPSLLENSDQPAKPKLSMSWVDGLLQGPVRTWYDNGTLESSREMAHNKKNGLASAWYRDGSLMLVEEYEKGSLVKGDYYRRGEVSPATRIDQGKGIASLFDPDGHLLRRVTYRSGHPIE
jgi:antitoxin component YwqK of YwqJK toxin-antitoxin module